MNQFLFNLLCVLGTRTNYFAAYNFQQRSCLIILIKLIILTISRARRFIDLLHALHLCFLRYFIAQTLISNFVNISQQNQFANVTEIIISGADGTNKRENETRHVSRAVMHSQEKACAAETDVALSLQSASILYIFNIM